jgi:ribosomal protein S18 acetylase RimI-like enzyme
MSGRDAARHPSDRMRIRQAVSGDASAVSAVVEAAYSLYIARIGRPPAPMTADYGALIAAGEVWVGDQDDSIVGALVIRPAGDVLELENVAVDPARQGLGYGRMLIAFAEQQALELGLGAVDLYTNEAMVENLGLYPRLGYVEIGRRLDDGYRRVYFRKALDARTFRR